MPVARVLLLLAFSFVPSLAAGEAKEAERGAHDKQAPGGPTAPSSALPSSPSTSHATPSTSSAAGAAASPKVGTADSAKKADSGGYLPYQEPGLPDSPGLLTVAGRVVGSLALVVGLIFVTAVGLRRFLGGKKTQVTSRKVTELVEVTPLGGKRYLYLIRVADRLLVVGSGGERLELLTEISDPAVIATVAAMPRQSQFFEVFHRLRAKEAAPADQFPAQC